MSDNTTGNMVTLMSKEGEGFLVSELVAKQSQMICHIIQDISDINFIPLPNVYTATLAMVIEYCKKHVDAADAASRISDEDLRNWDKQFLEVDVATLLNLLKAADYLNIKGLLDLTCQKVADMIKGKNPEVIRQTFNIKNDFTPKEEEEIQREFQWAFE